MIIIRGLTSNSINRLYGLCFSRLKSTNVITRDKFGHKMLISVDRINNYNNFLQSFGFSQLQAQQILEEEPSILSHNTNDISSIITNWYSLKILNVDLVKAITMYPKLLLLDSISQAARIKQLMTVFTQKDLLKLFKTCPEVYVDDFDVMMEKIQYLVYNMGAEQPAIIKSRALRNDIKHIKLRHNFLLCAGKFKKPKPKIPYSNAPLNKIFHKDINIFLKLSGLTIEEYDVFVSVFYNLIANENDDTDSEDDVD